MRYVVIAKFFTLILILQICLLSTVGCSVNRQPIPVSLNSHQSVAGSQFGRIDMDEKELAAGLNSAFYQLSQQVGPFDYEPVVKNHLPAVRKGLWTQGHARIRRLSVNGNTVDVNVYFLVDQSPATLHIDTFLNGDVRPLFTMVNQYYVSTP